jgi:hypothetical protein
MLALVHGLFNFFARLLTVPCHFATPSLIRLVNYSPVVTLDHASSPAKTDKFVWQNIDAKEAEIMPTIISALQALRNFWFGHQGRRTPLRFVLAPGYIIARRWRCVV